MIKTFGIFTLLVTTLLWQGNCGLQDDALQLKRGHHYTLQDYTLSGKLDFTLYGNQLDAQYLGTPVSIDCSKLSSSCGSDWPKAWANGIIKPVISGMYDQDRQLVGLALDTRGPILGGVIPIVAFMGFCRFAPAIPAIYRAAIVAHAGSRVAARSHTVTEIRTALMARSPSMVSSPSMAEWRAVENMVTKFVGRLSYLFHNSPVTKFKDVSGITRYVRGTLATRAQTPQLLADLLLRNPNMHAAIKASPIYRSELHMANVLTRDGALRIFNPQLSKLLSHDAIKHVLGIVGSGSALSSDVFATAPDTIKDIEDISGLAFESLRQLEDVLSATDKDQYSLQLEDLIKRGDSEPLTDLLESISPQTITPDAMEMSALLPCGHAVTDVMQFAEKIHSPKQLLQLMVTAATPRVDPDDWSQYSTPAAALAASVGDFSQMTTHDAMLYSAHHCDLGAAQALQSLLRPHFSTGQVSDIIKHRKLDQDLSRDALSGAFGGRLD